MLSINVSSRVLLACLIGLISGFVVNFSFLGGGHIPIVKLSSLMLKHARLASRNMGETEDNNRPMIRNSLYWEENDDSELEIPVMKFQDETLHRGN